MNYKKYEGIDIVINERTCETVGKIYLMFAEEGYDMEIFSNLFLKSDFCKREFDTLVSTFQNDEDASYYYIKKELNNKLVKNTKEEFNPIVDWIGYVYRFIYIYTGIPSSILADKVPYKYLDSHYIMFSDYDEFDMLDKIIIDNNLETYF